MVRINFKLLVALWIFGVSDLLILSKICGHELLVCRGVHEGISRLGPTFETKAHIQRKPDMGRKCLAQVWPVSSTSGPGPGWAGPGFLSLVWTN